MKQVIIFIFLIGSFVAGYAQFPGTDSLRNYNNKFITNNPATAFTNLRLNTLLRGIIDWVDTARAGTGGGGLIGVDTIYAVNDSTIRYRKNGVFRNFVLKGVYDTRRKVDTAYAVNDTTLRITINGSVKNIIIRGKGTSLNISNSALTANGDYTHNWNHFQWVIDSISGITWKINEVSTYDSHNRFRYLKKIDNNIGNAFQEGWALEDQGGFDSLSYNVQSTYLGTSLIHLGGNNLSQIELNGGYTTPEINIQTFGSGSNSLIKIDKKISLKPTDSLLLKATAAATADSALGVRAFANGLNTVVKFPLVKNIDVFLVAGQSNAKGHGDSLLSPKAITGKVLQINSGVIKDANDPVGINITGSNEKSEYGSAWPSFGNTYYNRTSHLICMVPSYKGGTSQTVAADVGNGNWDTTGILFDSAVARVKNAMTALIANGYNPIFKGVVWLQGESDAAGIQSSLMTQTDYTNAFKKMLRRFRQPQNFGATMPFYIIRIGTSTSYIDSYWKQIRDAQQSVANSDSMTQIVYYNALNFFTRGLMLGDNIHFNQVALNEIGQMTAYAITSHNRNIWQPQDDDLYYANTGTVAIGGPPTEDYDLEINSSKNSSHSGIKLLNPNTGSGAFAAIKLYNDAGSSGFIFTSSTTATTFPANTFTLGAVQSGGIRLAATAGDIVFSRLAQLGNEYGRYVYSTGNYIFNTNTDSVAMGKFQVNSTSWFNDTMKLSRVKYPPATYNVLVHGLTDSAVYQVPVSDISGGGGGVTDHGALTGLGDDDHTQYALLAGRSSGQTLIGGTGTTDDLVLQTTAGVGTTGADMIFKGGNNGATEFGRFLNNGRFGLGTSTPAAPFNLVTSGQLGAQIDMSNTSDGTYAINFNRASSSVENLFNWSTNGTANWAFGQDNDGTNDMLLYAWTTNKLAMKMYHSSGNVAFGNTSNTVMGNDGSLTVGNTTNLNGLVNVTTNVGSGGGLSMTLDKGTGSNQFYIGFNGASALQAYIGLPSSTTNRLDFATGAGLALSISGTNTVVAALAGSGTRIVTTDASGVLGAGQAISATPSVSSGSGAPGTTPGKIGDFYIDTTNFKLYFSKGSSSSADWIIAN